MLEDENDSRMMRNHLTAIILMTLLLVVWLKWFAPRTPPRPTQTQQTELTPQGQPGDGFSGTSPDARAGDVPSSGTGTAARWPYLPEPVVSEDPRTDEVTLENDHLRLVFTRVGARLKRASVLLGENGENSVQLIPEPTGPDAARAVYPMGLYFTHEDIQDEFNRRRFDVTRGDGGESLVFSLTLPGAAVVRKVFSLSDTPHLLHVRVEYENLEGSARVLGEDQTPAYVMTWAPGLLPGADRRGNQPRLVWRKGGENDWLAAAKAPLGTKKAPFPQKVFDPEWITAKTIYFMVAFKPEYAQAQALAASLKSGFRFGMAVPRNEVLPQSTWATNFQVYIGPNHQRYMAAAWDSLPTAHRFFESVDIMDSFAKLLLRILNWFYAFIPNYGLAIIFLTVLVRVPMFPLTLQQMRSMKRTQLLAPEIEKLKQKYGDDAQEMNKKMMELYRERGVNPFGGCLPVIVQMPVFIALYRMLWSAFEFYGAPFKGTWIRDLSEPDRLLHMPWMHSVPFLGDYLEYLNLLPILGAVAMIITTKFTPQAAPVQNPTQKHLMTIMPLFFGVICYNFSAGLNLYILTSTVLGIAQTKLIPVGKVSLGSKKPARKRRHFYTAAQARKRRIEKEIKGSGKRDGRKHPKGRVARNKSHKVKKK